ncbi:MAG: hypothetical protein R3Y67_04275 [Eubacteriales bacterium]
MLKVPQLDDVSYDQLVQRAINKIPTKTTQWTDFNAHDPGITILQTYAWLVDMLNYYMNATGDVHILKYLKLLGVERKKACKATAHLRVQEQDTHVFIPEGTKVYGGDICFEFQQTYLFDTNPLISYLNEVDGRAIDLTPFIGEEHDCAHMFGREFQENATLYFGFQHQLRSTTVVYFQVEEYEARGTFGEDFRFCPLKWQYYGKGGWRDFLSVEDQTSGFLKSGLITFRLDWEMEPYKHPQVDLSVTPYTIRCVLEENGYDLLPKLQHVYTNPMMVIQQDTVCSAEEFIYNGEDNIPIHRDMRTNDYLIVGIERNGKYEVGYEYEKSPVDLCSIEVYLKKKGFISFDGYERVPAGTKVQLLRMKEEFLLDSKLGITNGCCNQRLTFDYAQAHEIAEIGVTLWSETKEGVLCYEVWNYVELLEACDYMERVFTYDFETNQVIFGDGIHGAVPDQDLQVSVTHLVLSKYENGNAMPEEINRWEEERFGCTVKNPNAADGGQSKATIPEMLESLREVLFHQNRMVSEEDYKDVVKSTPALLIEEVQVVNGKRYGEIHKIQGEEQTVYLVIKQTADTMRPPLSPYYKKLIQGYIESYRLINTKVVLVSPNYVGVEVYGKIHLTNPLEQEEILEFIRCQVVGNGDKVEFGKEIILGKIFTKLEIFSTVRKVEQLSLERIGNGAIKNSRGDLVLYEDAIPYISMMQIEFV